MNTDQPSARVRRSTDHLADGREIIYYDDSPDRLTGPPRRPVPDRRPLTEAPLGSALRYDVLTGEWVAIASHRNNRTFLPPADLCPLCPTFPGRAASEIPASEYDVVILENRFPALGRPPAGIEDTVDNNELWPQRPAQGRCEVICFTSEHTTAFSQLEPSRVRTVVDVWADRTAQLSARPDTVQVFCFENRGQEIGVTLHHPHGQIYAYPFLTARTAQLLHQARKHYNATGGNLLGDVLRAEQKAETRVVFTGEHWTAYVPAAARWPIEVHLAPHRDRADLSELDDAEREELAAVYPDLLRRVERFHEGVQSTPYISGWHQAPVGQDRELGRLHLQLFSFLRAPGKLKYLAGSESGMGTWINDAVPEKIAARLREVG